MEFVLTCSIIAGIAMHTCMYNVLSQITLIKQSDLNETSQHTGTH